MRKHFIMVILIVSMLLTGCGQYTARNLGGTSTETLQPNVKLVNVTWKEKSLWIITRPMQPNEKAETYEFKESSLMGVLEGKIIIKEVKQ